MKKDHQRSIRRERIIMATSSMFVLGALTLSGVYMRNQTKQAQDDGYTIDFTAMEDRASEKLKEIAQNSQQEKEKIPIVQTPVVEPEDHPMEVGSDDIKIPGLTDKIEDKVIDDINHQPVLPEKKPTEEKPPVTEAPIEEKPIVQERPLEQDAVSIEIENPILPESLHFSSDSMVKPVSGQPVIDYSMSGSVYFATLDQYKYNPAIIYAASQGEEVLACSAGKVLNIYNDPELGHVLVLDLGDGYQAVYGQLENIEVPIGGTVSAGMKLASVALPTKYYSVEGANLYFQILKDGVSLDPNSFFQ